MKINQKTINIIIVILLLLIPIGLSAYFRFQPATLPMMDKQAADNVASFYKEQIKQQVDNQYAYLPPEKRAEIVNEQFNNYVTQNKESVKEQVQQVASNFKSGMQDENGDTYLIAIDPWMQYKYTENYIENGCVGDTIKDGECLTTLRDGRSVKKENNRFHPWLMAQEYKIMHAFNPDISPMRAVFLFPLIWVTLAVIPAFFIGRRLSNNLGGFVSAVIVAVHQAIMSRTVAGFSDTDSHNVFFPLFILWFIVEAYHAKNNRDTYIFGGLAGLFTGLFSMAWSGWWFTYDFVLVSLLGFLAYKIIKEWNLFSSWSRKMWKSFRSSIILFGTYFISSLVFVVGFQRFFIGSQNALNVFTAALRMPFKFLKYQDVGITTIWPNVLTTVAELNPAAAKSVINSLGIPALFFLSLSGLVLVMMKKRMNKMENILIGASIAWYLVVMAVYKNINDVFVLLILIALPVGIIALYNILFDTNLKIKYSILLVIFFTGTLLAATKGVRFTALLVPIFALTLGISAGRIFDFGSRWLIKALSINRILVRVVLVVLLLWIIIPSPINAGWNQSIREMPSYNDAWDSTLKMINQSSEDAIITSWWDFGHWFVAGSERRVTFDGGSQSDRIHWVGRILLENNETESLDILKMLNCGQNDARHRLEDAYNDDYKAIKTLYKVIETDKAKAKTILEESGLNEEDVNYVLEKTHCDDLIDQYVIASEDMIGKSGVWAHFGIWDFDRAYMFNRIRNANYNDAMKILMDEYNYSETKAKSIYTDIKTTDGDRWIAPWPRYLSGEAPCSENNDVVICKNGFVFNSTSKKAVIMTQNGKVVPKYVSTVINGTFKVLSYPDASDNVGAALYKRGDRYQSILMDAPLTASMFTRMYFFDGLGLKHFEQMSHKTGVDGTDIYLYKVNW